MKRKILTSFLIVALAHYLIGCAVYDTVQVSNAKDLRESNRVLTLVLHSEEIINFGEKAGEVVYVPEGVTGTTKYGEKVLIPERDIEEMYDWRSAPLTMEMLQKDSTIRVIKLVTWYATVEFDENAGRYTKDYSSIKGTTTDSTQVNIPFTEIKLAVMEVKNATSSTLSTLGLLTLLVICGVVLYLALNDDEKNEIRGGYIKPGFW